MKISAISILFARISCVLALQALGAPPAGEEKVVNEFQSRDTAIASARAFLGAVDEGGKVWAERITAADSRWLFADNVSEKDPAWVVHLPQSRFILGPDTAAQTQPAVEVGTQESQPPELRLDMSVLVRERDGLVLGAQSPWSVRVDDDFLVQSLPMHVFHERLRADGEAYFMPGPRTRLNVRDVLTGICSLMACSVSKSEQIVVYRACWRSLASTDAAHEDAGTPAREVWSVELRAHSADAQLGGAIESRIPAMPGKQADDPALAWLHTPERVRARKVSAMRYVIDDSSGACLVIGNTPFPDVLERTPTPPDRENVTTDGSMKIGGGK